MALVESRSGCKVGWDTYTDEQEAQRASFVAAQRAERMAEQGYDFGYLMPGDVTHKQHPEHGEVWIVVTP